jgi:hypothetical protein
MGITIFVLLFSIGTMALLAVLLKTEKIEPRIFAASMALLVIFDFSLLSLDKIYFLHQAQDNIYLEKQQAYDKSMADQLVLYKQLTSIQLQATLQVLAQNSKQTNEKDIAQKVIWRDQLLLQMNALNFDEDKVRDVSQTINNSVTTYLMERLNKEARQSLGHRIYSDFVRTRPRHEWTDNLFISELTTYLNKQNLMNESIELVLARLNEFKSSGVLLSNIKQDAATVDKDKK